MIIISYREFLALPPGTVFAKYEPHICGDLRIKGESIASNDFFYISLSNIDIDADSSGQQWDLLTKSQCTDCELDMDFDTISRDGEYNNEQLFAVWSTDDVSYFVERLTKETQD